MSVLFFSLLGGCSHHKSKPSMPPLSINYASAVEEKLSDEITFTSTLESVSSVEIAPKVSGYLTRKHYAGSCRVKRGELLYEIDPRALIWAQNSAQASLEQARAQYQEAYHNYMRAKPLAEINAVSRTELDAYRTTLSAAQAQLKEAESQLESATLDLGYTKIYAPMSGIIANTEVEEGDLVGAGSRCTTLTTLSNDDFLTAQLAIPTKVYLENMSGIQNNKQLLNNILLTLANNETYPLEASYDYTLKDITSGSSTVVIVVRFANPNHTLKSGMFARVRSSIGTPKDRVLIPVESISQLQGINSVWVISPDSTVKQRQITLGKTFGTLQEVHSGIKSGDKVATSGQLKLHDGAKVIPTQK